MKRRFVNPGADNRKFAGIDQVQETSSQQPGPTRTGEPTHKVMNASPVIKILRLRPDTDADIPLPRYMTSQSAGMDLCAAINEDLILNTGELTLIPTGFAIALPEGYEAQIRPRSGLAIKHGIGLINSPGTIDADYRGEIKIAVINLGKTPYTFRRGDRIAQMVIKKVYFARLDIVEELDETKRNTGGFGHTGK